MNSLITIILPAGRSAIELSLFVLLPVMVVMLAIMRLLEAWGVLDWLVARLTPVLRPFGLTGLGVFAALQVSFVSFAAPVATLAMMEQRGTSKRHLAAAFAMVLAMAQANAVFPMGALGLHIGPVLGISLVGGLLAAAAAYYLFGRNLSADEQVLDETLRHPVAESAKGVLDVINRAGAEAFKIAIGAIPMLVLSLTVVTALRQGGAVDALVRALPSGLGIDPAVILPAFTKYLAGGTAMLGVIDEQVRGGHVTAAQMNAWAGLLIHPLDLPGVAVLMAAGPRVASIWKPAVLGALLGIALRSALHILLV
ncbi:MAG: nucleoside recognition domain-containing protein [Magnetospirillum sp.]|nr:nucleoside recognition domain-containing protein [Magnetospirillum sp.]